MFIDFGFVFFGGASGPGLLIPQNESFQRTGNPAGQQAAAGIADGGGHEIKHDFTVSAY